MESNVLATMRREAEGLIQELRKIRRYTTAEVKEQKRLAEENKFLHDLVWILRQRIQTLEEGTGDAGSLRQTATPYGHVFDQEGAQEGEG